MTRNFSLSIVRVKPRSYFIYVDAALAEALEEAQKTLRSAKRRVQRSDEVKKVKRLKKAVVAEAELAVAAKVKGSSDASTHTNAL